MALPTPAFPDADWDGREQDTSNDGAEDSTLAQAGGYNEHSAEILEMQRLLRGKVASAHAGAVGAYLNNTGGALTCMKFVCVAGFDATTGLPKMTLGAADAATCLDGAGLLVMEKGGDVDTVADSGVGYVVSEGQIYGLATDGMGAAGTLLWPAASGGLSSTPVAGYLPVAKVDVSHASLGVLSIFAALGHLHIQDRQKAFNSVLRPTGLTGHVNDYNPTGLATAGTLLLTSDGAYNITGITAPAIAADGRELKIVNLNAANALTLKDMDAGSAAANKLGIGADIELGHEEGATLIYDGTAALWRCVGRSN